MFKHRNTWYSCCYTPVPIYLTVRLSVGLLTTSVSAIGLFAFTGHVADPLTLCQKRLNMKSLYMISCQCVHYLISWISSMQADEPTQGDKCMQTRQRSKTESKVKQVSVSPAVTVHQSVGGLCKILQTSTQSNYIPTVFLELFTRSVLCWFVKANMTWLLSWLTKRLQLGWQWCDSKACNTSCCGGGLFCRWSRQVYTH